MMNSFGLNVCKEIPGLNVSKSYLAARSNFAYSENFPGPTLQSVIICFCLEKTPLRSCC